MADWNINTPFMEKLNLNGSTVWLADKEARDRIDTLEKASIYLGVTATALTDGATTNPIDVYVSGSSGETKSVTAAAGNIVMYKDGTGYEKEFIFNGTSWAEFGAGANLKGFAFVDKGVGCFTPTGSVTFTNATADLCLAAIDLCGCATGCYTPSGTVTGGEVVAAGSVDVSTVKATGTVSLTGVKPEGSVDLTDVKAAGSVEAPEVTLGCSTDTVTTHTFCFDSSNHVLSITDNAAQTLLSCVSVACVSAPAFCGTGMEGTATFCGSALTGDAGFCGTGMEGTATFCGSCVSVGNLGFCGDESALALGVSGQTIGGCISGVGLSCVKGVAFEGCAAEIEVTPCTAS